MDQLRIRINPSISPDNLEYDISVYKTWIMEQMRAVLTEKGPSFIKAIFGIIALDQRRINSQLRKLFGESWHPGIPLPQYVVDSFGNQQTGEIPNGENDSESALYSENDDLSEEVWIHPQELGDFVEKNLFKFDKDELVTDLLIPLIYFYIGICRHFSEHEWDLIFGFGTRQNLASDNFGSNIESPGFLDSNEADKLLKKVKGAFASFMTWRDKPCFSPAAKIVKSETTFRYTSDEFKPCDFANFDRFPLSFVLLHALYMEFEKAESELQNAPNNNSSESEIKEKVCARLNALDKQDLKFSVEKMSDAGQITFSTIEKANSTGDCKRAKPSGQILFNHSTWSSAFEEAGLKDFTKAERWAFQRKKKAAKEK